MFLKLFGETNKITTTNVQSFDNSTSHNYDLRLNPKTSSNKETDLFHKVAQPTNVKGQTKKMSTSELISIFCGSTSAHGFSHCLTSSNCARYTWMVITLGAFLGIAIQLAILLHSYLRYGQLTESKLKYGP